MKKFAKIAGIVLLSLILLLIAALLIARFFFRQEAYTYLTGLEQQQRTESLRTAGTYSADTVQYDFTYIQDTRRARETREYFRLDTLLRGDATTWDNALALAKFVAANIPHANQTIYPEKSNAIALWEYHKSVEPAFNCRLHSIMLHELLLASGIANRFVTCLPQDSEDSDCHVVNIVWIPELQKWAMIDSDMQAYLTDKAGTPLSLEQMRRSYIDGDPFEVHRLFDENNTDYYTSYWAKNLYWFQCWEAAGYDLETDSGDKRRSVSLIPSGFEPFKLRDGASVTTDEARFWAPPTI